MSGLSDFRQQHPQYNDMPDAQLADALYKKFYSDIPRDQFNTKLGLAPAEQPSAVDRIVASPIGRAVQENVIAPVLGLGTLAARQFTDNPRVNTLLNKETSAYEGALARNRNTPGYAAARAKVDNVMKDTNATSGAFMPSMQSAIAGTVGLAGGLDTSNAMADAAGKQQQDFSNDHPFLSTGMSLVGGLLGTPAAKVALPAKIAKTATPSVQALKAEAQKAYQIVDNSGLTVSEPAVKQLAATIQADVEKRGFHPMLHSKSAAVLDVLKKTEGEQSIQQIEILRRIAKEGAKSPDRADKAMARVMQDHIDNFMENLSPAQLSSAPDPQAQQALLTARDLWTKASRGEIIEDALDKAKNVAGANYTQAGYATAVRQRFRQIANNDRAMARFAPEQRDLIKAIVRGSKTENVLRLVGKLAVRGPVSGITSLAGYATVGPAAILAPIAGEAAKAASTSLTVRAANRLSEAARGADIAKQPLLMAPNHLPSSVANPYLIGNALVQTGPRNALAAPGQ